MFLSAVLRPRGGGKTTALAEIAFENSAAIMVVGSLAEVRRIIDRHGLPGRQVVTFDAAMNGALAGREHGPLLLDNFDHMIYQFFPHQCGPIVISATGSQL